MSAMNMAKATVKVIKMRCVHEAILQPGFEKCKIAGNAWFFVINCPNLSKKSDSVVDFFGCFIISTTLSEILHIKDRFPVKIFNLVEKLHRSAGHTDLSHFLN